MGSEPGMILGCDSENTKSIMVFVRAPERAFSLVSGLHRMWLLRKPEDEKLQEGEVICIVVARQITRAVILSFPPFGSKYMAGKQSASELPQSKYSDQGLSSRSPQQRDVSVLRLWQVLCSRSSD